MGGHQTLTLTKSGDFLEQGLGFVAHSVIVDNYTTSFCRVPGANRDVPPGVFGAVLPIDGTQVAEAKLISSVPAYPAIPVATGLATLTFVEEKMSADSGHMVQTASLSLGNDIDIITALNGNGISTPETPPAGSLGIGILPDISGTNQFPATVTVVGTTTKEEYAVITSAQFAAQPFREVRFSQSDDPTVTVTVNPPGGQTSVLRVSALPSSTFATVTLAPTNTPGGGQPVDVIDRGARILGIADDRPQPYDAFADSGEPAGGVVATCTIAAINGVAFQAALIRAEVANGAAAGGGAVRLRLRDGASGVGTILQSWVIAIDTAQGSFRSIEIPGAAFKGSIGVAMTLEFSGALANTFLSCGLGVYKR